MSDTPYIVEVTQANVQSVLKQSMQVPVLLDFWAGWCQSCKQLLPIVTKLANEYKGRFILAKVDTDAHPMLSQQLGVRSLPTLKLVFRGQLVGELVGLQPESEIRKMLDAVIGAFAAEEEQQDDGDDPYLSHVEQARRMEAYDDAITILRQAIEDQPKRLEYQVALADVLMDMGQFDEAQTVLDNVGEEPVKAKAKARLFFLREVNAGPELEVLQQQAAQDAGNMEALYFLALHHLMAGDLENGLEMLLQVIQKDRAFRDDAGRKAYITALDLLGAGNPLVSKYRRRLFALMH